MTDKAALRIEYVEARRVLLDALDYVRELFSTPRSPGIDSPHRP